MVYSGDQDFYCSFTHLPHSDTINLDELPYTIHSPYSIDRIHHTRLFPRSRTCNNSFSSSTSTSSFVSFTSLRSFLSRSSSRRKQRKFIAKVRHIIPGRRKSTPAIGQALLMTSRKPSTLDFRCIGPAEDAASMLLSRVSTLNLAAGWNLPVYEAPPRLDWREPDIWSDSERGANWFASINA